MRHYGLIVLESKIVASWTCTLQMIEVIVSVLRRSFLNIFLRWRLDKLNWFFILTARLVTTLIRARAMRMTAVTLITPLTRMPTRITSTQPIHQRRTLTTFLQQVLTATTHNSNPSRSNPITVPVLSLHLIHLVIVFSRRPLCHFGYD